MIQANFLEGRGFEFVLEKAEDLVFLHEFSNRMNHINVWRLSYHKASYDVEKPLNNFKLYHLRSIKFRCIEKIGDVIMS